MTTGITAAHNRIYRQPGTSWGIEWVVTQPPVSSNYDNIIKNAGLSMQDESCIHMGGDTNCAITRQYITNNYGCGGNTGWNASVFSKHTILYVKLQCRRHDQPACTPLRTSANSERSQETAGFASDVQREWSEKGVEQALTVRTACKS